MFSSIISTKKRFSAKEVQRQLGHERYQPNWHMLHKLRGTMGKCDEFYELTGEIELDEGFFSTEVPVEEKDKPLKLDRGSQKKTKVLVMAESKKSGTESHKGKPRQIRHIKMKVIHDLKSESITPIVEESVSKMSTIVSDDSTSYVQLKEVVQEHMPQAVEPKHIAKLLTWIHIAISNAKRQILDINHDIKPEFLPGTLMSSVISSIEDISVKRFLTDC